jgi:2-iminoacetate synthase
MFKALSQLAKTVKPFVTDLFRTPLSELRERAHAQAEIDGRPKVFFAPIYVSNECDAGCWYCGFAKGSDITRYTLTIEETEAEVAYLKREGYDAVYILTGSTPAGSIQEKESMTERNARGLRAVARAGLFPIMESSPFTLENFQELLEAVDGRGRYVLFQEVYDQTIYRKNHSPRDPFKGDPEARLQQMDLALRAGWKELGIGVLGLNPDQETELAYQCAHQYYLRDAGAELVTISVPRMNPATGVKTQRRCSDEDFFRGAYTLRILCPESPLVITGRETPEIRNQLWPVTEIWGVKGATEPGGYVTRRAPQDGQFSLVDRRTIAEIIRDNS